MTSRTPLAEMRLAVRSTHAHRLVASCGLPGTLQFSVNASGISSPPTAKRIHMEISVPRRDAGRSHNRSAYAAQEVLRFRGGTALGELHFPAPPRNSEGVDQRTAPR
jgi:hypothetical protein